MADLSDTVLPSAEELAEARREREADAAAAFKKIETSARNVVAAPITGDRPDDARREALYASRNRKQSENDVAAIAAFDPSLAVTYEGVVDTDDFLHLDYFVKGITAAGSVGQIRRSDGMEMGTGFICAPGMIITNNHVISSQGIARFSEIVFEIGASGSSGTASLDPDRFYFHSPKDKLDFTIVAMEEAAGQRLTDRLGWHPFKDAMGKTALGRPVSIIQYPRGRGKQIVLHNSMLVDIARVEEKEIAGDITPLENPYLWYTSDTKKGSSGSPVFNRNFEIIALHHAGVPKRLPGGAFAGRDGSSLSRAEYKARPEAVIYKANRGIRASRIVSALREAKPADFIDPGMMETRDAILDAWRKRDGQDIPRQRMRRKIFRGGVGSTPDAVLESVSPGGSGLDSHLFEEIVRRVQNGTMTVTFG